MEIKKAIHWAIITPSNEQTDGRELGEKQHREGGNTISNRNTDNINFSD